MLDRVFLGALGDCNGLIDVQEVQFSSLSAHQILVKNLIKPVMSFYNTYLHISALMFRVLDKIINLLLHSTAAAFF